MFDFNFLLLGAFVLIISSTGETYHLYNHHNQQLESVEDNRSVFLPRQLNFKDSEEDYVSSASNNNDYSYSAPSGDGESLSQDQRRPAQDAEAGHSKYIEEYTIVHQSNTDAMRQHTGYEATNPYGSGHTRYVEVKAPSYSNTGYYQQQQEPEDNVREYHTQEYAEPISQHIEIQKPVAIPYVQKIHVPIPRGVRVNIPHPVLVPVPKPYPVHIPVSHPVAIPVIKEITIPIEKVVPYAVEKKVPVPIEKPIPYPVEKHIPVHIPKPYPVRVPIVKTILHRARVQTTSVPHVEPNPAWNFI